MVLHDPDGYDPNETWWVDSLPSPSETAVANGDSTEDPGFSARRDRKFVAQTAYLSIQAVIEESRDFDASAQIVCDTVVHDFRTTENEPASVNVEGKGPRDDS